MSALALARTVLVLTAAPFAAIGVAFLAAPQTMAAHVDVTLGSPTADHDVRAVYGGLQLGCAALLAWGALVPAHVRTALVAQLVLYAALAGGRILAWTLVGAPGSFGLVLHGGELLGLVVGAFALHRLRAAGST